MIDVRHGYAIAKKVGCDYLILTTNRGRSTQILLNAHLEPARRMRDELAKSKDGLVVIQIIDNRIVEVADDRANPVEI